MGRVRKYKKLKACDPFANRGKGGKEGASEHDEPPELFEAREQKARKRKERSWDDENTRELMLQREALRTLRESEKSSSANARKIEGKKTDESMKDFKTRIRQETRNALRDELKNLTSTAKKRKVRLKERKIKREGGVSTTVRGGRPEYEEGFSSSSDGRLRPSDLGGSDEFAKAEVVRFGERVLAPPVFSKSVLKFAKKADSEAGQAKKAKKDQEERKQSAAELQKPPLAKKKKVSDITDTASANIDRPPSGLREGIIYAGNGSGKSSASADEMEELRKRVQESYKRIQEKRRLEGASQRR